MTELLAEQETLVNSLVGDNTSFKGDIVLSGLLRIDGDFSGTIRTGGKVLIGKQGRVESTIVARSVVIGGVVKGNVMASEKIVILSTGMLIGNVTTPRLIVEEGVIMHGMNIVSQEKVPAIIEEFGAFSQPQGTFNPWKK